MGKRQDFKNVVLILRYFEGGILFQMNNHGWNKPTQPWSS